MRHVIKERSSLFAGCSRGVALKKVSAFSTGVFINKDRRGWRFQLHSEFSFLTENLNDVVKVRVSLGASSVSGGAGNGVVPVDVKDFAVNCLYACMLQKPTSYPR